MFKFAIITDKLALYFSSPGAFRGNKAQKASRFQSVCCEMHMALHILMDYFLKPNQDMLSPPWTHYEAYYFNPECAVWCLYRICRPRFLCFLLKLKKKINIPLGSWFWAARSSRRLVESGWDAASTNTVMPGQLDMLNAFDSVPCEPWCVQLNTPHLNAHVQPD